MNSQIPEVISLHFDLSPWERPIREEAIVKVFTALSFKGLESTIDNTQNGSGDQGILFKICRREFQTVYDLLAEEFNYGREDSAVGSAEVG